MIDSVIFDLDNTLIDSSKFHLHCLNKALEQYKLLPFDERLLYVPEFKGALTTERLDKFYREVYLTSQLKDSIIIAKKEIVKSSIRTWFRRQEETIELLEWFEKQKFQILCVTDSERSFVYDVLSAIECVNLFDDIYVRGDTDFLKPNPWVFLEPMYLNQIIPKNCLIFEDSPNGLRAAKDSGANYIAIDNPYKLNLKELPELLLRMSHA